MSRGYNYTYGFYKARRYVPNFYRPWCGDDIMEVVALFKLGEPVNDIAKSLGRTRNAVASRLVTEGLLVKRGDDYLASKVVRRFLFFKKTVEYIYCEREQGVTSRNIDKDYYNVSSRN